MTNPRGPGFGAELAERPQKGEGSGCRSARCGSLEKLPHAAVSRKPFSRSSSLPGPLPRRLLGRWRLPLAPGSSSVPVLPRQPFPEQGVILPRCCGPGAARKSLPQPTW